MCRQQVFELIFTDIQMPHMNGLEFMQQFGKINKDNVSKVIVLSGFDYFEYAQKALTYGAFSYLLKPLDLDAFQKILELAENAIEKEANKRKEKEQISQKMLELLPVYSSSLLLQWINGALSPIMRSGVIEILGFQGAGHIAVAKLDAPCTRDKSQIQTLLDSVRQAIDAVLLRHKVTFYINTDIQNEELVIILSDSLNEAAGRELAEGLRHFCRPGVSIAVGVSKPCRDIINSAHQLVKEARLASLQQFYDPECLLFFDDKNKLDPLYKPVHQPKEEVLLLDAVRNGQAESIRRLLTDMRNRIIEEKYPLPEMLRTRCKLLMIKIIEGIEYLRESDSYDDFVNAIETQLDNALNERQLFDASEGLMLRAVNMIAEMRLNRRENMVYQCLEYVDNHYMEDISLEQIAEKFDLSPGYFSQYFKNKLDINYSKYLNQVRLLKAKKILETQEDKIYEVALQVGYQEVKYFNRVFKKEFDMTPEEFRKMMRIMKSR